MQRGSDEVERSGEEEEDIEGDRQAREDFAERWGWIANVDAVSETCRCSWDEVWQMSALEFLNILAYRKDKMEKEKAELEQWRQRH